MTSKEFYSELEIVLSYLGRTPNMLGVVKLHLYQYNHIATSRKLLPMWHRQGTGRAKFNWINDMCYFYDEVIELYFLSYEVLENLGYSEEYIRRTMRSWIAKVSRRQINLRDLGQLLKRYEELVLRPLQDTETGVPDIPSLKAFKAELRCVFPDIHWWFDFLKKPLLEWFQKLDITSFRAVYQIVAYMLRSTLKSLDLRQELCDEYVAYERKLHKQSYESVSLADFRKIAYMTWPDHAKEHFVTVVPHHGPGANSEEHRQSLYYKYNSLSYSKLETRGSAVVYGGDWFLGKEQAGWTPLHSQIVDVPKNYNKRRIISKEDPTNQYMQHGIHDCMYMWLRDPRSAYFKHIDLEHQEYNGEFARLGSYCGEYATVDLSAASDSVTVTLVRQFPKWLRNYLFAFRSPVTKLPDGRYVDLEKFAPMGADTCFPTECIAFAICCMIAICRYHKVNIQSMSPEVLMRMLRHSSFRVYGDDIVIEQRYIGDLYAVLSALGFEVNKRKSYTQCMAVNFRESCGYEYVNGIDVKPLRVSRKRYYWHDIATSVNDVTQFVAYYNEAFDYGFRYLCKIWYLRIRQTKVFIPRDWRMPPHYEPLYKLLPFIHADNFLGQCALKTWVPPTNYQLMRGALGQQFESASTCRADHAMLGTQNPLYWGLCIEKRYNLKADQEEIRKLAQKGCPIYEPDYIRWMDYWGKTQRKIPHRHYIPKEITLPDVQVHERLRQGSPDVCGTVDTLRVRPCLLPV